MLVDEGTALYRTYIFSPFAWVHQALFEPIATFRPYDIAMAALLWLAMLRKRPKGGTVGPMRRALFVAALATAALMAYGLARGGDARAAGWQVYLLFATILMTFTFATVFHTAEHFVGVVRTIVWAGAYHAVMCIIFYFTWVRPGRIIPFPEYMTTHDDSVLWTIGVGFLFLSVMQNPTRRMRWIAAFGLPLFLYAIQLNKRRLAWISLGGALVTMYFLLPPSKIKRRIRRVVLVTGPVIILYTAIGWGRTESIFKPLLAFQTVSTAQDKSTLARNAENLGLIATANQGWLMGTGWGHKYVEVSNKYAIYFFELWPYVPHNSILGLFAYTGYLGFLGYWMTFPMAAFFHARTARLGDRPVDRFVGVVGMMQLVACADQWYGDMGSFSSVTDYTLATCFAAALRVPVAAGVWSDKPVPKPAPEPEPEPPARGAPEPEPEPAPAPAPEDEA